MALVEWTGVEWTGSLDWTRAFDLRTLEIYLSVCDTRNMVQSGERLGITQAAVSQAVGRLEESLATQLVDRSVRPIRLTAAGGLLRDKARLLLAAARQTRVAVQGLGHARVPELRLALVNSLSGALMPELYDFLSSELQIEKLSLLTGLARNNIQALVEGDVDVVMTTDAVEEAAGLPSIALLSEPFIIVAPKGKAKGERLDELAERMPYLGYSATCAMGRLINIQLRRLRLEFSEPVLFDSSLCLMDLVSAGRGWTIATPLCLLEGRADPDRVEVLPIRETMSGRRITLLTRQHELGELPQRVASLAARTAQQTLPARLSHYGAWLMDEMTLLPDAGGERAAMLQN